MEDLNQIENLNPTNLICECCNEPITSQLKGFVIMYRSKLDNRIAWFWVKDRYHLIKNINNLYNKPEIQTYLKSLRIKNGTLIEVDTKYIDENLTKYIKNKKHDPIIETSKLVPILMEVN